MVGPAPPVEAPPEGLLPPLPLLLPHQQKKRRNKQEKISIQNPLHSCCGFFYSLKEKD